MTQSNESAAEANDQASKASAAAARGGEVVSRAISTMQSIEVASAKIGDITSVIDGIAFQTNILALNASVEAARAGEQGAGLPWWRAKCVTWRAVAPGGERDQIAD